MFTLYTEYHDRCLCPKCWHNPSALFCPRPFSVPNIKFPNCWCTGCDLAGNGTRSWTGSYSRASLLTTIPQTLEVSHALGKPTRCINYVLGMFYKLCLCLVLMLGKFNVQETNAVYLMDHSSIVLEAFELVGTDGLPIFWYLSETANPSITSTNVQV